MSDKPAIILHLGAPHCGSQALQKALSLASGLRTSGGHVLTYTDLRARGGSWTPLSGKPLRRAAAQSVEGHLRWSGLETGEDGPLFAALDRIRTKAGRMEIPVVSQPDWLGEAERCAAALPHWFAKEAESPVEICAFARPPLDWLNAAYWRWGIWTGRGFGSWLEQTGLSYRLGAALTRWAALPGTKVTLRLDSDVLAGFEAAYGPALPRPARRADALPPAMLGFLMRNRRYCAHAHDTATEAIFQRWCRVEEAPRLWAVLPRHLRSIREAAQGDLDQLFALLPEQDAQAARTADARWTSDTPYQALLLRGRSPLDDPEELAQLYRAVVRGVASAAEAAGKPMPQLQPVLSVRSSVHTWDVAVAQALEHLIALDADLRRNRRPFGL